MHYVDKIYKFFLLLFLFSSNLLAQTATTIDGYPVIDLSALNPLGAVLSSADASTKRTQINQQTPSNTAYLAVGSDVSNYNGTWNAKMSIKFQIMRANHSVGAIDWATAYDLCKSYNGEGGSAGQWRLPTQRELMMIWILHPQLIGKGGFTEFITSNYWSLSENNETVAWGIALSSGMVGSYSKTNKVYVRCIRDL